LDGACEGVCLAEDSWFCFVSGAGVACDWLAVVVD